MSTDRPTRPAHEENPDRPDADAELTELAEAALLGALLWDPHRLRDVSWLEADDFYRPAHQAIYRTLTGLLASGTPIDLLELPAILARGDDHDLYIYVSNGPRAAYELAELLARTPASPPPHGEFATSGHSEHRRYAGLVLESSIRRQVLAAGTRIEQTDREYSRHELSEVFDVLDRVLGQITTRLNDLTSRLIQAGPATMPPSVLAAAASAVPAPTSEQLRRAEYDLIGGCQTQPWLLEQAQAQLLAEDFTHPEVAATWIALTELTDQHIPVDFVLLAAQVQRLGAHPDYGHGLGPRELATLARRSYAVSGTQAITEVTRAALTRAVAHAQRALADAGRDGHTSHQILGAARAALDRVEQARLRLDDNTDVSRPAAARRAAPAPRVPASGRITSASAGAAARMRPRTDDAPLFVPRPTPSVPKLRR